MTTTVSFIVVLGILVTVHELGHFIVAKLFGIGVDRFSIGFPPKMFGFTKGETEYCISWIPLGGYVKLRGEEPDEEIVDADDPALYSSRPPHQRGAVIMAGPVMNLVLAFIVMPLVFMVGIRSQAIWKMLLSQAGWRRDQLPTGPVLWLATGSSPFPAARSPPGKVRTRP